jgi:hypothetical protein
MGLSPIPEPKIKSMEAVRKLREHYSKSWSLPRSATKEEIDSFMLKIEDEGKRLADEAFEWP